MIVTSYLSALVVSAVVYWNGNFDTGDTRQWSGVQAATPFSAAVEQLPDGRRALHARLWGIEPLVNGGKRAEVVQARPDLIMREGNVMTLKWSTRMGPDGAIDWRWLVWTQFHHLGNYGSPPVEFCVHGSLVSLRVIGTVIWSTTRDKWVANYPNFHRMQLRVKWSNNNAVGWVEMYVDGQLVVPKTYTRTLIDAGVYLKMGIYRHPSITTVQYFHHDDVEMWIERP